MKKLMIPSILRLDLKNRPVRIGKPVMKEEIDALFDRWLMTLGVSDTEPIPG